MNTYGSKEFMSLGIFKEIERLIEYIPIDISSNGIGKLIGDKGIDTRYYFDDIDGVTVRLGVIDSGNSTVSLREIINLLNKFLKDAKIEEIVESPFRYRHLQNSGSGLPLKNLLFEFCLSALEGDMVDSKLYLTHSLYLLGLRRRLVILLSALINEPQLVKSDKDVRRLLTYLAILSEPNNIDIHFDKDGDGFSNRYSVYLEELKKISIPISENENCKLKSIGNLT